MIAQVLIISWCELPDGADEPVKLWTTVQVNGHERHHVKAEAARAELHNALEEQQTEARTWLALALRGDPMLQPRPAPTTPPCGVCPADPCICPEST